MPKDVGYGPKPKGNVTGNTTEKIGKVGNTKGETSKSGVQWDHMPDAGSYSGRMGGTTSGGASSNTQPKNGPSDTGFPFLPKAPKRG